MGFCSRFPIICVFLSRVLWNLIFMIDFRLAVGWKWTLRLAMKLKETYGILNCYNEVTCILTMI